jgi:hypothetical protein
MLESRRGAVVGLGNARHIDGEHAPWQRPAQHQVVPRHNPHGLIRRARIGDHPQVAPAVRVARERTFQLPGTQRLFHVVEQDGFTPFAQPRHNLLAPLVFRGRQRCDSQVTARCQGVVCLDEQRLAIAHLWRVDRCSGREVVQRAAQQQRKQERQVIRPRLRPVKRELRERLCQRRQCVPCLDERGAVW